MKLNCANLCIAVLCLIASAQALPTQIENDNGIEDFYLKDDIILTEEQEAHLNSRKAWPYLSMRWSGYETGDVTIPYRFNDCNVERDVVRTALDIWEDKTCIVFTEVAAGYGAAHIAFVDGPGCSSFIGRVHYKNWPNGQPLRLAPWCTKYIGFAEHEIGHALGFYHEQDRSDRDDYLIVRNNSPKKPTMNYGTDYDYTSIMHYGNGEYLNLLTRNVFARNIGGGRKYLSFMDIKLANLMYGCINKWVLECKFEKEPCWNKGYTGKDCKCVCPAGTLGERCEVLYQNYQEAVVEEETKFSEVITTEGTMLSPYYPRISDTDSRFVKVITAPKGFLVKLTFNDFDLPGYCATGNVQLSSNFEDSGKSYCGTTFTGSNKVFKSSSNTLILSYHNKDFNEKQSYRGYNATIEHVQS